MTHFLNGSIRLSEESYRRLLRAAIYLSPVLAPDEREDVAAMLAGGKHRYDPTTGRLELAVSTARRHLYEGFYRLAAYYKDRPGTDTLIFETDTDDTWVDRIEILPRRFRVLDHRTGVVSYHLRKRGLWRPVTVLASLLVRDWADEVVEIHGLRGERYRIPLWAEPALYQLEDDEAFRRYRLIHGGASVQWPRRFADGRAFELETWLAHALP